MHCMHRKSIWWSFSVLWLFSFSTKMEENARINRACGSHAWWHWNVTLSSITGWQTTLLMMGYCTCCPPQLQTVCHRLYHARGIVQLHELLVALKNQEDETDHRKVINDDGIYDIRIMNVLPKQVLAAVMILVLFYEKKIFWLSCLEGQGDDMGRWWQVICYDDHWHSPSASVIWISLDLNKFIL